MTYVGGYLKEQDVPFGTLFQGAGAMILVAGFLLVMVRPAGKLGSAGVGLASGRDAYPRKL